MTLVRIDPLDFSEAADNFHAVGVNILDRLSTIHGRLRQYEHMAGDDQSGEAFAAQYDQVAASILNAVDRLATQATNFDRALAASGIIHASAESSASLGTAAGAAFGLRPERVEVCPAPPATALGGDPNEPPAWTFVKDAVGMVLPNGNPDQLRGAADAWRDISVQLDEIATEISRADNPLAWTKSAEVDAIQRATGTFAHDVRELADACAEVAEGTEGYAGDIEEMRAEVFRMVAQLAIEVAASIGIGVALSFVTFGAAGAAAGGLIAARIVMVATRIVQLITSTFGTAARVAARIAAVHARLIAVIARIGSGGQAWIRVGIDVTAGTAAALTSEGIVRGDQANYLVAGVGGFVGGGVTAGILAGFARRADTLLANVLAGGGGGLASAVGSGVVIGKIDPASLVLSTVMGAGGGGLGTFGQGGHGISVHNSGAGGGPTSTAGPDSGGPRVPDGTAPDGTGVDLSGGPKTPGGTDGPTVDGPTVDGPASRPPVSDGPGPRPPVQDGPVQDGPVQDGPVQDGPVQDGPVQDGPVQDGPVQDGPVQDGPVQDGPVTDGPPTDGPTTDAPPPKDAPTSDPPPPKDDPSRIYTMTDGVDHTSAWGPDQLGTSRVTDDVLTSLGTNRQQVIDLINTPVGDLTPSQRDLLNDIRNALTPQSTDTVFQKVLMQTDWDVDLSSGIWHVQPGQGDAIIANGATSISGSVTVLGDSAHLGTPEQIYNGLRLDYPDTNFSSGDGSVHVLRFQVDGGSVATPSVNTTMGGTNPKLDDWDEPFTGNGYLGSNDIIPESRFDNAPLREGAEIWEILDDGTQRLVAVLRDTGWVRQG